MKSLSRRPHNRTRTSNAAIAALIGAALVGASQGLGGEISTALTTFIANMKAS